MQLISKCRGMAVCLSAPPELHHISIVIDKADLIFAPPPKVKAPHYVNHVCHWSQAKSFIFKDSR